MFYSIFGKLTVKSDHFFVLDTGGVSYKLSASQHTLAKLPDTNKETKAFTYLYVREDALELYGFTTEEERNLFQALNSVSGIGPKTALGILGVAKLDQLTAAINEGRSELLTRVSGIGKKTAERIVLELKGRFLLKGAPQVLGLMESDMDLEETLVSLGFTRGNAKTIISKIDPKITGFKDRLKEALRLSKPQK
jgi:holliday junction DNA helicase RuvA